MTCTHKDNLEMMGGEKSLRNSKTMVGWYGVKEPMKYKLGGLYNQYTGCWVKTRPMVSRCIWMRKKFLPNKLGMGGAVKVRKE